MRIRKRFPLSSMASGVSDPQLNNSTSVQPTPSPNMLVQDKATTDSQPSDPPNQPLFSDQPPMMINNTGHIFQINQKEGEQVKLEEASKELNRSNNITRKEYDFFAAAPVGETGSLPPLSSHDQVGERWIDGDEKIPLKKRKGLVENTKQEGLIMLDEEKKMKPGMKSKTNKKCSTTSGMQQNHGEQDKAGNDELNPKNNVNTVNTVKKINKRGGAIMEGSRCSRVNGRGWRCCQQTLVGYSLCEHHLGKGRLRSITNVKGRTKVPSVNVATTIIAPKNDTTDSIDQSSKKVSVSSSVVQPAGDHEDVILLDGSYDDDDEEQDEDEGDQDYNEEEMNKPLVKKKRMKFGMVKARSLSSLLNQTN